MSFNERSVQRTDSYYGPTGQIGRDLVLTVLDIGAIRQERLRSGPLEAATHGAYSFRW